MDHDVEEDACGEMHCPNPARSGLERDGIVPEFVDTIEVQIPVEVRERAGAIVLRFEGRPTGAPTGN
ncbi:MAG: hypothetical protein V3T64_04550 [Myxococcota bacterium]